MSEAPSSSNNNASNNHARVIVIGAGQAGLSAAGRLVHYGLVPDKDLIVLDAGEGPGGAWRDRWDSLTFDAAHGIADLPGLPIGRPDPTIPASIVVTDYYGRYEEFRGLNVIRPVEVTSVERNDELFIVTASDGRQWTARSVVSATGTWNSPFVPYYQGIESFRGEQLHTRHYRDARDYTGKRVLVVGAGASGAQFILDLARNDVETVWTTRRTPDWTDGFGNPDWGVDVERRVNERTTAGLPTQSVVKTTGLDLNSMYIPWLTAGILHSRGPLLRLTESGAVLEGPGPNGAGLVTQGFADDLITEEVKSRIPTLPGHAVDDSPTAWEVPIDVILWATGFRAHLGHLKPLHVRERSGGVFMAEDGVTVVKCPGLFLVGYGASASTIGATRAGRKAAVAAMRFTD